MKECQQKKRTVQENKETDKTEPKGKVQDDKLKVAEEHENKEPDKTEPKEKAGNKLPDNEEYGTYMKSVTQQECKCYTLENI